MPKKEKRDKRGDEAYNHYKKAWQQKKLVKALFMNVKKAFNYVARK
jgi:hypothetical protein